VLFILFCEYHPGNLLPGRLLHGLVSRALHMPGTSLTKVYDALKALFRDLDEGAETRFWRVPRYNGELFKHHPILDEVEIPDDLAVKPYVAAGVPARTRIEGAWGLHVFDFWKELDRDLLGNIFERSIADIVNLTLDQEIIERERQNRRDWGVFYTSSLLAKFVAGSAVDHTIGDQEELQRILAAVSEEKDSTQLDALIERVLSETKKIKLADLTCGSGVFLTAGLDSLLVPYRKALEARRERVDDLTARIAISKQSEVLSACVHGVDRLPQAVELAKLSLWLTAARPGEVAADLSQNLLVADSLGSEAREAIHGSVPDGFDVIVGNPPWGGVYDHGLARRLVDAVWPGHGREGWDSWEIFVLLTYSLLRPGGRFALLVPDTLFSPEKERTRRFLVERTRLEKVYALGPDWFGPNVRMGTVIIQARKEEPGAGSEAHMFVLSGEGRTAALGGRKPLVQIERELAQGTIQSRIASIPDVQLRVFSSERDYRILDVLKRNSIPLSEVTVRFRGDEINAEGLVWRCPNCLTYTVPGTKRKGGGYNTKLCPSCDLLLDERSVQTQSIVSDRKEPPFLRPYVDGKILNRRYERISPKFIREDIRPLHPPLKDISIYADTKILIRQAGVGVTATIDYAECRCPQSIYIYRVNENGAALGYTNELILAALVSRTMNYFVLPE
jgi:hypothetical protein